MSDKSKIEWTDATWNPLRGCTPVSEGCRRCYAAKVASRFPWGARVAKGGKWLGNVEFVESALTAPLRWREPRRIFVNSMSDLFHDAVPDEWIDRVFAVMALAQQHTFQILTKRPARMRAYLIDEMRTSWRVAYEMAVLRGDRMEGSARSAAVQDGSGWPLRNVWLGVSVEDQATADERIPLLLQTPAAVRFVSAEPLLGPIDFRPREWLGEERRGDCGGCISAGDSGHPTCEGHDVGGIDGIIVGGESGPGARPCDIGWIRSTVAQCRAAGVACFVKQVGADPTCTPGSEGEWPSTTRLGPIFVTRTEFNGRHMNLRDRKGGDPAEWPEYLRVRQLPGQVTR